MKIIQGILAFLIMLLGLALMPNPVRLTVVGAFIMLIGISWIIDLMEEEKKEKNDDNN